MAPKGKKGRGKKIINLNEFNEDYIGDDVYDWADDSQMTTEQQVQAKLEEKIAKQRHEYSRTANNALGDQESFRTAQVLQPDRQVTFNDLQPPFVAHFGNLRNGTTEEDFLTLFNESTVVTHRLINQDGKTFAFVEFNSAQAIAVALVLDGTMQRGRKMYVDLATPKQVERLLNNGATAKGGPGFSRDQAGQQVASGLAGMDLSRDAFGGPQPEGQFEMGSLSGMRNGASRSNFGSRVDLGELSRDLLGSAVQGSPTDSSSPMQAPADFGNWRTDEAVEQPDFAKLRENRSDDRLDFRNNNNNSTNNRRGSGNERGSPVGPVDPPSFGNWRDEPTAEVPTRKDDSGDRRGGRGGARGAGRGRGGAGGDKNDGGRRDGPRREGGDKARTPVIAPPAGDDRWGEFRK